MPFDASPQKTETDAPFLDPAIKRKWVDALRSGKYRQIYNHLSDNKDGRCVLGVFHTIATEHEGSEAFWKNVMCSLVDRNDAGESFASFADWIEANL